MARRRRAAEVKIVGGERGSGRCTNGDQGRRIRYDGWSCTDNRENSALEAQRAIANAVTAPCHSALCWIPRALAEEDCWTGEREREGEGVGTIDDFVRMEPLKGGWMDGRRAWERRGWLAL
jgi:hypothetical protein